VSVLRREIEGVLENRTQEEEEKGKREGRENM